MQVSRGSIGVGVVAAALLWALPAAPASAEDRPGSATGKVADLAVEQKADKARDPGKAKAEDATRTEAESTAKAKVEGTVKAERDAQSRSAPSTVEAAVYGAAASVTLTWTLPDDNVAAVGFRLNGATAIACPETATDDGSCQLTEVPPGQYAVEYREDAGAWTDAGTSADVPVAPPAAVTATPTVHGLSVTWEPSASPGVTGYVVTATPEDGAAPAECTSTTGCALTGLTYQEYEIDVVAQLGDAESAAATVAASPLPETPAAPSGVTAKLSGPNAITITWNAVPSTYGVPIRYMGAISTENAGRGCWDEPMNALTCTVDGLSVGTTYTVTAFAIGDVMSEPGRAVRLTVPLPSSIPPGAPRLDSDLGGADPVAGGNVRISGAGFQPHSTVVLAIYSAPVVLGSAAVEADGTFSATVTLPDGLVGEHALLASGIDPDGDPRYMQLALTIAAGGGGGLPVTGAPVALVLTTGAGLVLSGGGLLVAARPRRRQATAE